jgi:hypothetical protein
MPNPPPSKPNPAQATSHVVRNGRRVAKTGAGRAQAPAPFMHSDPINVDARENKPPPPARPAP